MSKLRELMASIPKLNAYVTFGLSLAAAAGLTWATVSRLTRIDNALLFTAILHHVVVLAAVYICLLLIVIWQARSVAAMPSGLWKTLRIAVLALLGISTIAVSVADLKARTHKAIVDEGPTKMYSELCNGNFDDALWRAKALTASPRFRFLKPGLIKYANYVALLSALNENRSVNEDRLDLMVSSMLRGQELKGPKPAGLADGVWHQWIGAAARQCRL